MFGLSYFRLGAYAIIAIVIGYLIYQYHIGQQAKTELVTVKKELSDEISCVVPSKCASDSIIRADESIKAIQKVQAAAKEEYNRKEANNKANEEAATKRNIDNLKKLQSKLYKANLNLIEQSEHSKSCKLWLNEIIACTIE